MNQLNKELVIALLSVKYNSSECLGTDTNELEEEGFDKEWGQGNN